MPGMDAKITEAAGAWTPARRPGEEDAPLPLEEAVGQALGAASGCWENLEGAGVFDSTRCKAVLDWLLAYLGDWAEDIRREATEATVAKLHDAGF